MKAAHKTMVILGSGNVAWQFAFQFQQTGLHIVQVYNRTKANADALALALNCISTDTLQQVEQHADYYFLAVSDDALPSVVDALPATLRGVVLHCSGATPISILHKFASHGVIYPPQSLSKNVETDFSSVPLCIEANTETTAYELLNLVQSFAPKSILCNTHQRLALHVAAVFCNNFSNLMNQIAFDILTEAHLPFDLITPIIKTTAEKVQHHPPRSMQTGPAIRNDQNTIDIHLQFLSEKSDCKKIYQLLTEEIKKRK